MRLHRIRSRFVSRQHHSFSKRSTTEEVDFQAEDLSDSDDTPQHDPAVSEPINNFLKQMSFEVKTEGLPPGWYIQMPADDGCWFFVDRTTTWVDPKTGKACAGPYKAAPANKGDYYCFGCGPLPKFVTQVVIPGVFVSFLVFCL